MSEFPPYPPQFPMVFLLELLFGIGFNKLVEWAHHNRLWHVSTSVSIGVAVTLIIPILLMGSTQVALWQSAIMYFTFFAASGTPMIWGSTVRTVDKMHKRRRLPNFVMKVRDEVVMDMNAMADKIVAKNAEVAEVVHELHKWIGSLKSL